MTIKGAYWNHLSVLTPGQDQLSQACFPDGVFWPEVTHTNCKQLAHLNLTKDGKKMRKKQSEKYDMAIMGPLSPTSLNLVLCQYLEKLNQGHSYNMHSVHAGSTPSLSNKTLSSSFNFWHYMPQKLQPWIINWRQWMWTILFNTCLSSVNGNFGKQVLRRFCNTFFQS